MYAIAQCKNGVVVDWFDDCLYASFAHAYNAARAIFRVSADGFYDDVNAVEIKIVERY